jgi:uncharacterized membrane protein
MVLATVGSGVYKLFLFLHILCAVVGFGGVLLNGAYAAQAQKRPGPGGLAISEANEFISGKIAEMFIYAVFVFGIITAIIGRPVVKFDQGWLSGAMGLFVVGLAIAHAVLIPGHRKINNLLREMAAGPAPSAGPPPQVAQVEALGKRQALFGMLNSLIFLIILFLMVVKPGGPGI